MRRLTIGLALGLLASLSAGLSGRSEAQERPAATTATPPQASASGRPVSLDALPDSVRRALQRLQDRGDLGAIETIDRVLQGPARLAHGDTLAGSLVVQGGSLEVEGVVRGSVAVVGGDLIIADGALIDGSASAVGGTVRVAGGEVTGEIRSTSADPGTALSPVDALDPGSVEVVESDSAAITWRALKLVFATFAILMVLGIGLLLFSQPTFDAVVQALEDRFTRSFWIGVLAQFAVLPMLLLLVTALAISLIGILLIPFAVVAYVIAVVGLLALGFLAAARITGRMFGSYADGSPRSANLRALVLGLAIYLVLWLLAAATSWHPLAGTALRSVALAASWVAMTVGLGAIISAGLAARRARSSAHLPRPQADPMAWQTPTPITGVVAARRPLSSSPEL